MTSFEGQLIYLRRIIYLIHESNKQDVYFLKLASTPRYSWNGLRNALSRRCGLSANFFCENHPFSINGLQFYQLQSNKMRDLVSGIWTLKCTRSHHFSSTIKKISGAGVAPPYPPRWVGLPAAHMKLSNFLNIWRRKKSKKPTESSFCVESDYGLLYIVNCPPIEDRRIAENSHPGTYMSTQLVSYKKKTV